MNFHGRACRTARRSSRSGFTLVELLVVIGIIAILAGVSIGPILRGLEIAKHNATVQTGHQIGQMCFSYATDNSQHGNTYPADTDGYKIAQDLLNANYASDPSVFVVNSQKGVSNYSGGSPIALTANNCSWSFTVVTTAPYGGITSAASDLTPLVYFNNGPGSAITPSPFPATPGTGKSINLEAGAPFGQDGITVFYKGANAVYLKAGMSGTPGQVDDFVSSNDNDTTAYLIAK